MSVIAAIPINTIYPTFYTHVRFSIIPCIYLQLISKAANRRNLGSKQFPSLVTVFTGPPPNFFTLVYGIMSYDFNEYICSQGWKFGFCQVTGLRCRLKNGQYLSLSLLSVEDGNGVSERAKALLHQIIFCILRSFNGVFTC